MGSREATSGGERRGRAYVVGACFPNGGTYTAYHLGRILDRHVGYEPRDGSL